MKKKIYIIGSIPNIIDSNCEARFYKTQMQLLQMGYDVVNPIERLTNKEIFPEDAKRKNLQDLMLANAAYIMPCVKLGLGDKNLELKLALDFNLVIVVGLVDLSIDKPENNSKTRNKKIKIKLN